MQTNSQTIEAASRHPRRMELSVEGMTCNGCARNVTNAIQGVSGVESATVSLQDRNALVRWKSGSAPDIATVVRAVEKAGFKARMLTPDDSAAPANSSSAHRESLWSNSVFLGVIPTAMLMAGEWIFGWSDENWFRWTAFALAGFVQFGPGLQFYRGAWNQLKAGQSNMDTLVSLGSTTAFGYSTWALLSGHTGHLYFMEAAAIITLISVGHWIEARVSSRAAQSLKSLMNLAPTTARRRDASGAEHEVSIVDLTPGDVVVLKAGDRVPTDGEVIEGSTAIDESMLTGESLPVEKKPGATLYAGTANESSRVLMRVTSIGEETALAQIIAAVQRAQSSRANIQRLGDRVSNVFVPIVIAIAIGTALLWGLFPASAQSVNDFLASFLWRPHAPDSPLAAAIIAAASVLIIACPCAMGLATPAAIMAGANSAARRGILIRDGVALEKAGQITALVFDKTGTLTEGKPRVVDQKHFASPLSDAPADGQIDLIAASLAATSNHPLSKAIAAATEGRVAIRDLAEQAGRGVSGEFETHHVQLGALRWLADDGATTKEAQAFADDWMSRGATIVGVAIDRRVAAVFALRDTLKPGARELIQSLGDGSTKSGLGVYIVSGDTQKTVRAIADELELNRCARSGIFAEVHPDQKAVIVQQLQQKGERVAFVGDGINDAPALEQADLGIAVSRASDVAREAADIILLRSDIQAIPESLGLARATLRTIKQNLFWAFFYNALGIPLAALGFMSPVLCAAAMGVSDLVVIGNALRLLRWKEKASH